MADPNKINVPLGGIDLNEFKLRLSRTKVKCLMDGCSFEDYVIVDHLAAVHKMTVGQYKIKMGEDVSTASPIVTELLKKFERRPPKTEELAELIKFFEFDPMKPVDALKQIKDKIRKPKDEAKLLIPKKDKYFLFTDALKSIAYCIQRCKNLYVEGPTGCGKTAEIIQAHAYLEIPIKRMNMNGEVTVANFLGQTLRHSVTHGGGTYFKYGALPLALKYGYSLLIDEIDYMPANIGAVMNPVLEGDHSLYIPETDETIYGEEGFHVYATGNTGGKGDINGQYSGTEVLNTSFLDRFQVKLMADYLPLDREVPMLLKRFPRLTKTQVELMCKGAKEVRDAFKKGEIAITMSTRKLIDYFDQLDAFGDQDIAISLTLGNWLQEQSDYDLVKDLLDRVGIKMPKVQR